MSLVASIWAWEQTVDNPLRKLILLHMADSVSKENDWQSWYSLDAIAKRCDCSRGAVRTHLKALVEMQYLTQTRPSSSMGRPAMYRLNVGTIEIQIGPNLGNQENTDGKPRGSTTCTPPVQEMYVGGTGDVPKPVIEPVIKPKDRKTLPPEYVDMVLRVHEETLPELTSVVNWKNTQKRATYLLKIYLDDAIETTSEDFWRAYFLHVRTNDWWMGRDVDANGKPKFKASFEFLVHPTQFLRIFEECIDIDKRRNVA